MTVDLKERLHGGRSGTLVETNIHTDRWDQKDGYAVWQKHTDHPPGHTNYTQTGFTDGTGDMVYLGLL